jgi:DNA (cytosine-5)-methyltransferase 1
MLRFVDLFCGIGGFRVAAEQAFAERRLTPHCVFSCDIDPEAQDAYEANFGERPAGDITRIDEEQVPDHDLLFAGFPCQAFSICGDRKGFDDTRGTLFFDIARILDAKRPQAFVLENVKQLSTHDNGTTMRVIHETLRGLGYHAQHHVLNALDFGLPQKRERTFIVGFREPLQFRFPTGNRQNLSLEEILLPDSDVPPFYWASEKIRRQRLERFEGDLPTRRTVWHENKGGHISAYPFSCAMRAGASYNYLLVDGKRRLTEREMLRLQGFPDSYKIVCGYGATRRHAGNSVAVPVVAAVIGAVLSALAVPQRMAEYGYTPIRQFALEFEESPIAYAVP